MKQLLFILLIPTFSISMKSETHLQAMPLNRRVLISFAESMVRGTVFPVLSQSSLWFWDYENPKHLSHTITYTKAKQAIAYMRAIHLKTQQRLKEKSDLPSELKKLRINVTDSDEERTFKTKCKIDELLKAKHDKIILSAIATYRLYQFLTYNDLDLTKTEDKTIKATRAAFFVAIAHKDNNQFIKIAGQPVIKKPALTTLGVIDKMIEDHKKCNHLSPKFPDR